MKELLINEKNAGGRLDKIVFKYLDLASSGFVYKMLRKKNITLNDKKASGGEIVQEGDSVKFYLADETIAKFKSGLSVKKARENALKAAGGAKSAPSAKQQPKSKGRSISLKNAIIFEDENLLAVNKPAGLLSQKAKETDMSANDFILEYIPGDDTFTPGISNRLDRNTSGIILAGKNLNATRELNRAIKMRSISKKYLTIVKGKVEDAAHIEAYLTKDEKTNTVSVSLEESENAEKIITSYVPVSSNEDATLLEIDLITGKSHQIRAHLASIGHPVIGDTKYGDSAENAKYKEKYNLRFQLLHAAKIEFNEMQGILEYLNGTKIEAAPPANFIKITEGEGLWLPGAQEA